MIDFCSYSAIVAAENKRVPFQFSGLGEVYSWTVVPEPTNLPEGFEDQGPLVLGLIKTVEGPLVLAQLTDLSPDQDIEFGMPVEMVTRKLTTEGDSGIIIYGYKFRPRLERGG